MKICPQCQNTYTDDSLQYCLQDGTPLNNYAPSGASDSWADSETLVTPVPARDRIRVELPSPLTPPVAPNRTAEIPSVQTPSPVQPPPQTSNTLPVILATAFGVLLLVGLGGAAAWFYFKNSQPPIANANTKPSNAQTPNQSNANQRTNANTNANVNAVPTATPTPKPTLRPEDVSKIETDVANVVENWRRASDDLDLDAHLGNYADTVDYYNAGRVNLNRVRADKERAFAAYDTISISVSGIRVKPDETGERATALFDKEWSFQGEEKSSSGKVQQQLELQKIGGKWRITGEKDLKVYYVDQ